MTIEKNLEETGPLWKKIIDAQGVGFGGQAVYAIIVAEVQMHYST